MTDLIVTAMLIGNLQVTSYRSVPNQTDTSPFITSIGERVNNHGVAVSQDLLQAGQVKYGDTVYIEGYGEKVVNDCMGRIVHYKVRSSFGLVTLFKRQTNAVDIWVATRKEESRIGVRKNLRVWVLKCSIEKSQKHQRGRLIGASTPGSEILATILRKIQQLTPTFSVTKTDLTPGTDWPKRMKRTSTLTTAP